MVQVACKDLLLDTVQVVLANQVLAVPLLVCAQVEILHQATQAIYSAKILCNNPRNERPDNRNAKRLEAEKTKSSLIINLCSIYIT